jgi:hypothetical protein
VNPNLATATAISTANQGHSGESRAMITPSMICRAISGTSVWQALPSNAPVSASATLRRWLSR